MSIVNAIRPVIIFAITFCIASPAMALRCDNRLVTKGLAQAEVRKYCGAPINTQQRMVVIERTLRGLSQARLKQRSTQPLVLEERVYEEVQVDEWTYNFGPRRFMAIIRFTNGRVTEVEDLGYGYHD